MLAVNSTSVLLVSSAQKSQSEAHLLHCGFIIHLDACREQHQCFAGLVRPKVANSDTIYSGVAYSLYRLANKEELNWNTENWAIRICSSV